MKERLRALLPYVGLPAFYLFCLLIFFKLTFPYDKIRDRIVASSNKSPTGPELKIDELGPGWRLLGATAKGIHLVGPGEPGKPPVDLVKIDDARVSVSPFGAISFHADAYGGTLDGDYDESSKESKIDLALDNVDVGPYLTQSLGFPIEGAASGTVKLTLPDQKLSKATGSISLEAVNVTACDGKTKIGGMIAPPRLAIGTLTLAADAKDGAMKITKLTASGKDLDLQGDGRIQLREQLTESFVDVNVRIKISDAYRGKSDTTKSIFGDPASNVPGLIEMMPKVKQMKRGDGSYGVHLHGAGARIDYDAALAGPGKPGP